VLLLSLFSTDQGCLLHGLYIPMLLLFFRFSLTVPLEEDYTRMYFTKFSGLVDTWVGMINMTFVLQLLGVAVVTNQFWV